MTTFLFLGSGTGNPGRLILAKGPILKLKINLNFQCTFYF